MLIFKVIRPTSGATKMLPFSSLYAFLIAFFACYHTYLTFSVLPHSIRSFIAPSSSIIGLFELGCPFAISWLIITIVIDAL